MTPLRQRMINDMTVRGLAESTRASYLRSVTRLARHYRRSPEQISAREVQDYLLFLHQQHGLSWSTCNTIRHGVRFLLPHHPGLPDPHFYVPGAKEPLHAAPDPQSRRVGAPVHRHHQPQAPRRADDRLCRGASCQRTRSIAGLRYRLRSDVSAYQPGQGQQGPLRPPLASAVPTHAIDLSSASMEFRDSSSRERSALVTQDEARSRNVRPP